MSGKPQCVKCPLVLCYPNIAADETPSFEGSPGFCPSVLKEDIVRKSVREYQKDELREFARLASVQESECYERTPDGFRTKIPRIEETIQLAHKNNFKKLGLAFCVGVMNEARMVTGILETKGFEVVSICCKVGAIPKEVLGIRDAEKISGAGRYESMCSPITQAEILNSEDIDFAILMGLCVGHDTLFIKYCNAPMTVLAVKDRVTGHNPLAAVYLSHSYYGRLVLPSST
jgi:uncharacterized metal-binding protein